MRIKATVPFVLLAIAALAFYGRATQSAPPAAGPIPVKELRERGVEGVLGESLGRTVTVHGTVVSGNRRDFKEAQEGRTYLKVSRVGDRELKEPVFVEVRAGFANGDNQMPADKSPAVLTGYETGAYEGRPDPEAQTDLEHTLPHAGSRYDFRTWFVARKAE
jgi:hypothetical protein